MNIDTLKLFFETVHRGSFAAVARDHAMNPSSVSRVIAGLEEELGFRLFQRTTRRMRLTEAGVAYAGRVEALVDELEHAREQGLTMRTGMSGTLRMTASVAFGKACIIPLLGEFRSLYPNLKLEFLFTDERLDLITNRLDLAVRLGPVAEVEIIRVKLFDTHFRVCASPAYVDKFGPLNDPNCLSKRRCLRFGLPQFKSHWRFQQGDGPALSVPVDGDIMIHSAIALRDAAVLGLGPAMLADWMIRRDLVDGRLIDLLPAYHVSPTTPDTTVWLLYLSRTYLPNKVRVMIDFLKSKLGSKIKRSTLVDAMGPTETSNSLLP